MRKVSTGDDVCPDSGRRVGPPECRWHVVSLGGSICGEPSLVGNGMSLLLCKAHAAEVARSIGYASVAAARHQAEKRVAQQLDLLRAENARLRKPPPLRPTVQKAPPPTEGTIYFLRSGGYFKIGWTSDLEKRMKGYPPDVQLVAVQPGTMAEEKAIHKRFGHLLGRGREWFLMAPEIEDHVDRVVAEHGRPPVVDFAAKRATRTAGRQKQYVGGPNRGSLSTRTVRG